MTRPPAEPKLEFFAPRPGPPLPLPLVSPRVAAGFPSPAEDYLEGSIDLNRELVKRPAATFLVRVSGASMRDAGIDDGDVLVVDKSLPPASGRIAVCCLDGSFTLKRIRADERGLWLVPANDAFAPIPVNPDNEFAVWGIVTYVIKKM